MYSNVNLVVALLPLSVCLIQLYSMLLLCSLCNPTGAIDGYASFLRMTEITQISFIGKSSFENKWLPIMFEASGVSIWSFLHIKKKQKLKFGE